MSEGAYNRNSSNAIADRYGASIGLARHLTKTSRYPFRYVGHVRRFIVHAERIAQRTRNSQSSARRSNVEADEHTLSVRQVANDLLDGLRQPSYESWNRQYLVPVGELRVLEKVDDLDLLFSRKAPVTDHHEVRNGLD